MNDDQQEEAVETVEDMTAILRKDIGNIAFIVKGMMSNERHSSIADIGETKANIMLAYRHLEDARMRLGKVFQAQNGGESNASK